MKTKSIFAAAVLLMTSMNANTFAANLRKDTTDKMNYASINEMKLYQKVEDNLHLPTAYKIQGSKIETDVVFTVNDSGKITDIICKSKEKQLSDSVINQLKKISFPELQSNIAYGMTIKFRVF